MAKARPKIPRRKADTAGDRNPAIGQPRPSERDPIYREIGDIITKEWVDALAGRRELDREKLQRDITARLRLAAQSADPDEGDPMGEVEVGVICDPKPVKGVRKFVWIVVPYPEAPPGVDEVDWMDEYNKPQMQQLLGEAVLFGCGR